MSQPKRLGVLQLGGCHRKNEGGMRLACEKLGLWYGKIQSINEIHQYESQYDILWCPNAFVDVAVVPLSKWILFGPHFFVTPNAQFWTWWTKIEENQRKRCLFTVLSEWNYKLCVNEFGSGTRHVAYDRIRALPFGVDVDQFCPSDHVRNPKKLNALLYIKHRHPSIISAARQRCAQMKDVTFTEFVYGSYNEREYLTFLQTADFGIWVGSHESQGFALEEALACNVPLFVWDVTTAKMEFSGNRRLWNPPRDTPCLATTVPYWSDLCGEVFYEEKEWDAKFAIFLQHLDNYRPREYILSHLTPELCLERLYASFTA